MVYTIVQFSKPLLRFRKVLHMLSSQGWVSDITQRFRSFLSLALHDFPHTLCPRPSQQAVLQQQWQWQLCSHLKRWKIIFLFDYSNWKRGSYSPKSVGKIAIIFSSFLSHHSWGRCSCRKCTVLWKVKKTSVDRGSRKGAWDTECGENHGELEKEMT